MMRRILMVCTGNTCRSPMAEALLRDWAARTGTEMEVRSAGVAAQSGMPISTNAAETLRRTRVALPGASTRLDRADVEWADLILTMTVSHKRAIAERYPHAASKTYTLKEYARQSEALLPDLQEMDRLHAEFQVALALGKPFPERDKQRLTELSRRAPDLDIADPYGGPLAVYEACAREIREAIERAFGGRQAAD
ncbi:low molecular weight protein arginine phosphatase [Cohnella sp. GbtcB17]|uniref:low molecular weight protein arginine phosphatase n=1 Tax=Cohnella sp. GbtcB17 TaxID=2824762 RepID=UPI0027D2670B|nr:low molecular weight protein arginine phosphatase [Cohnella sp. GbtcB17]